MNWGSFAIGAIVGVALVFGVNGVLTILPQRKQSTTSQVTVDHDQLVY